MPVMWPAVARRHEEDRKGVEIDQLLKAGGLDSSAPLAQPPQGLISMPKGFQLQVSAVAPIYMFTHLPVLLYSSYP